jgi:hypothetical protein
MRGAGTPDVLRVSIVAPVTAIMFVAFRAGVLYANVGVDHRSPSRA